MSHGSNHQPYPNQQSHIQQNNRLHWFYLLNQSNFIPKDSCTPLPENLSEIRSYIDAHFQQISSVKEVAAHFFYSREYVSRVFKQHYNINLSEYLVNQKINHAKRLLEQGNSVSFSCNEAGFKSTSAFINAFRMRTNMTPAEYKRSCKADKL